jgi:hypothetical protein
MMLHEEAGVDLISPFLSLWMTKSMGGVAVNPQQHGGGSLRGPLLPGAVGQPKADLFVATLLLDEKSLLDSVKGVYSAICDWHQTGCNLPPDRFDGHPARSASSTSADAKRTANPHTIGVFIALHGVFTTMPVCLPD